MGHIRAALIWCAVGTAIIVPLAIAARSPLLAWRDPVYDVAGFAGIVALSLLLLQPLLIGGLLPGLQGPSGRRVHRWIGAALVLSVALHVAALWITSPPDVVDALLLNSPTPFSLWGVIAMWAVLAAALLALVRRRLRPARWRAAHASLAVVTVGGSIAHALLIEGTMGTVSKVALCLLVAAALVKVLGDRRPWRSALR